MIGTGSFEINPQSPTKMTDGVQHRVPVVTPKLPRHSMPETDEYALSEEELYDLMQEVEEEIRRSEEELLEEVLEQERCQQADLEQQIADYEEWEESVAMHDMGVDERVVCPICCESVLHKATSQPVFCPNEACPLQLQDENLTLSELKNRLRLAFEEHSHQCHGTLSFELLGSGSEDCMEANHHLFGSCQLCHKILRIS